MGRVGSGTLYGTLNLLVLKTLQAAPLHGLGLARRIEARAEDDLQIEEGALYPALHRLERDGLLVSEWGTTEEGRRAKFYDLTPAGRRELAAELERWERHTRAVARVLELGWAGA